MTSTQVVWASKARIVWSWEVDPRYNHGDGTGHWQLVRADDGVALGAADDRFALLDLAAEYGYVVVADKRTSCPVGRVAWPAYAHPKPEKKRVIYRNGRVIAVTSRAA